MGGNVSEKKTGVQLEPHMVIRRPLVTEKGVHASERLNAYTFEIHPLANKADVKKAVEKLWDVRVAEVRTQNRQGKPRRARVALGRTKGWKKAIVKLHDEDRISFF
ncbi:MAG: 50S ribosomal protein L23 [Fuerstiella sp.]|jgi:large subunit ribosomal protein L23